MAFAGKKLCDVPDGRPYPGREIRDAWIESKMKIGESDVSVTYTLRSGEPYLEVAVRALWLERGGPEIGTPKLRRLFPIAVDKASGTYEVPFGAITRDLNKGEEVPSQRFADVSGEAAFSRPAGMLVLNDSKYGHSLQGSTLAITLIRSSFEPDLLPEIGEHDVRMAILPHAGAMTRAEMIRQGVAFNRPLQVVGTGVHAGRFPAASAGLAAIGPASVVVSEVRKAESGHDLVIRLYETEGTRCTARVKGNGFTVEMPAHGIATVRVRMPGVRLPGRPTRARGSVAAGWPDVK